MDQTDLANGWASPLPRDVVFVTAAWPAASDSIGYEDDWLRLVFTHEFTHIVHLDRSEGWARFVRGVFGRVPLAFPNLFLPEWQIEGLATFEESRVTGAGRLHAGDFAAIVGQAARARRLEPLDRVNGGLVDWPGGLAPYAYGAGFTAYLAERFGEGRLAQLADATARRLPFLGSGAYAHVFGERLGTLWNEYEASRARRTPAAPARPATQLTHQGFVALGPRFDGACGECPLSVLYSTQTPHELPSLYRVTLDGSAPRRLATRYLGSTVAPGRDRIYFDQQEVRREAGLYSDLYALDRRTGRIVALTHEARLLDPDLSPDGSTIVAVRAAPGRRDLVAVRLEADRGHVVDVIASEPETQFDAPRWSPDGRSIAVERQRRGEWPEIVVVDAASRTVRVVAAAPATRIVTPAWRPDGRAIVAAAARADEPFNLYEFPIDGGLVHQLTYAAGGATWPDVSPDGRSIVYVGLTAQGSDLFEAPYADDTDAAEGIQQAGRPGQSVPAVAMDRTAGNAAPASAPYSPWATLAPVAWTPLFTADSRQLRAGIATGGSDVLGYHAYAASATWLVRGPSGRAGSPATPDWEISYAYTRWRPLFFVDASEQTSFFAGPPDASGLAATETLHERELQAGVVFPVSHVRVAQTALLSFSRAVDRYAPSAASDVDRAAIRAGWAVSTAHRFGYSISGERGVTIGATTELVRSALGASGDARAVTADARAYLPGVRAHDVVALRVAGGWSAGDRLVRRGFNLGGGSGNLSPLDFGREAISLLRGFPVDTFAGTHVALVNADYRFPIAWPQRGVGTWPLFLRAVHGAVIADAGHAWTRAFEWRDVKADAGAELALDIVAGYSLPLTVTAGAAWGRDGSGLVAGGAWYVRVGRAF
ncbi:MAG: hypothetical protein ACM3SQ_10570 [Betaproteobacteria bacterium]